MSTIEKEEHIIEPLETVVNSDKTNIEIEQNNELEVTGHKKEYSIVGDGLYAGIDSESAPAWLTSIIDNVVSGLISKRVKDLDTAIDSINKSLLELEVAKNQYQELINIDSRIDSVLASRLETLNATIQQNSANIIGLDTAKVTPEEALAISIDHVNAQINNGGIHALVTDIKSTIANNELSAAQRIETLESVYNENESTVRSVLSNSAGEYSATANAITDLEIEINEGIYGETGLKNTLEGAITDEGARVESKFSYNSVIGINGVYKKSGFGLTTNYTSGSGTEADPYISEFWIDASRFKFTNSNQTGGVTPFTIDATGSTPQITFNGIVDFTNTNTANGLPATTRINGGLIETNTVTANQINTAGLIAENISADTIYGKKIVGAIIEGAVIKASFLDLNQGLKLLTSYVIPASTYLANMSDYPDCVYESDTNTYRIPTLTRVNENTKSEILSAGGSLEGALSPYNAAKEGNLLKARLIRPTFETTGSFRMVTTSNTASGFDSPSRINFSIKLGPTEVFRFQYSRGYNNSHFIGFHEFTAVSPYYGNSTITLQYNRPDYMTVANPMVYSTSADVLTPLVKVRINVTYKLWWKLRGVADGGVVYEVYQTQTIVTLDTLAFRNKIPFDWVSGHIAIVNNSSESVTAALNSHLFIDNTQA